MNEDMNYASSPDHKDVQKINIDNMFTPGVVDLRSGKKVSVNTGYLNSAVTDVASDRTNSVPVLKQAIDNFIAYKNFDFTTISPQEKQAQQSKVFLAMDEIYQQIGTKDFEKATTHLSSYQVSELLKGVEDYNTAIARDFTKYRIEHPNESARLSQGPTGTLIATGGSEDFHMKYLDRINTSLKAYANLQGRKSNEVSNEFYSKYYGDIFTKDVKDLRLDGGANAQSNAGDTLTNFSSSPDGGGSNKKVSFKLPSIITEANAGEVDSKIIPKLIQQESKGVHINPSTMKLLESEKGAKGVTQVMPATGVDPGYGVRPLQNSTKEEYIRFSKDYFKAMLGEFNGNVEQALAAYNYGPVVVKQKVRQYGNNWKQHVPAETQNYIASIME
jgi:hypothetical protein